VKVFDTGELPIYVRPGYTDGRKSINGLVGIIHNEMQLDVLQGGLFIFCSKARTNIKCVLWDGVGFWLIQKRLVGYTFAWPNTEEDVMKISGEELQMLLQGIDVFRRFIPWANVTIN
jgi:transposase